MLPVAHAADWIESIVLGLPVIGFLVWLGIAQLRDRRRAKADSAAPSPGEG